MSAAAREALVQEVRRTFPGYAQHALKIQTKAGDLRPFMFNAAQKYVWQRIHQQFTDTGRVRARVLKARQEGVSTLIQAWFYYLVSGEFGKRAFILTHEQEATNHLFSMTQRFHDNVPEWVKPHTGASNAKELFFDSLDSGYSVATAGSKNVGRSKTVQYFHGSEVAFWPNAGDHMAGIGQAVPNERGTVMILESTANGIGNLFHAGWQESERGQSEYLNIFVPWYWMTEYRRPVGLDFQLDPEEADYAAMFNLDNEQMCFRRLKIKDDFQGDASTFDQEYPATPDLAFRKTAGQVLIRSDWVTRARLARGVEGVGPRIMGVDPAEYGDDSTAFVLRQGRTTPRHERHHGRGPMEVVALAASRAEAWNADAIVVDAGGLGSGISDRLAEVATVPVHRVLFGERAIENDLYVIRRDELWGDMSKWFQDLPCQIPDDDSFQSDLCGPTYTHDSSRRLKVEPKEKMKARGLKSPDLGDALALTFALKGGAGAGYKIDRNRVRRGKAL